MSSYTCAFAFSWAMFLHVVNISVNLENNFQPLVCMALALFLWTKIEHRVAKSYSQTLPRSVAYRYASRLPVQHTVNVSILLWWWFRIVIATKRSACWSFHAYRWSLGELYPQNSHALAVSRNRPNRCVDRLHQASILSPDTIIISYSFSLRWWFTCNVQFCLDFTGLCIGH